MERAYKAALIDHFSGRWLTDRKVERFHEVLNHRTRHLTVVLENIFQPHNASAVIRSCDAFGLQDLHVIELNNRFAPNKDIALGSQRWIQTTHHSNSAGCIDALKASGYQVVATTPHTTRTLASLPIDKPLALCFGEEKPGLSQSVLDRADHVACLPMYGFAESYNLSVSVALGLYDLRTRLQASDVSWGLGSHEKLDIFLHWCRQVIPNVAEIEQRFRSQWST
jgi:tRNA (guanosine-2'-O-)-methyltransferase|tara:strand:+ start:2094 stop:2765 length:672 start_codon:yes stop_codon:yes gene_type:complete